jgi:hypothetical protein
LLLVGFFFMYCICSSVTTIKITRKYNRAWQRPPTTRPTTFHVWKTRGCQCSFRLLMMGGVSPETCWVSYNYGIIKFWYIVASCWIFLYEFYYDARIHEHQVEQMDLGLLNFVCRLQMHQKIFRRLIPTVVTSRESGRNVLLLIVSSRRTEFICFSQTPQEASSENKAKKHWHCPYKIHVLCN